MAQIDELPDLMIPAELAKYLRTTPDNLAQDRCLGQGVPFIKHGHKILYAREEVRAYLERSRRERTEPRKAAGAGRRCN
jgi:hypothetical protein